MIYFFSNKANTVYAVQKTETLDSSDISKLSWLFGSAQLVQDSKIQDYFVGPRAAMVTPWSTNAVEITQNMDIHGILRIEEYTRVAADFRRSIRSWIRIFLLSISSLSQSLRSTILLLTISRKGFR